MNWDLEREGRKTMFIFPGILSPSNIRFLLSWEVQNVMKSVLVFKRNWYHLGHKSLSMSMGEVLNWVN